MQRAEIRLVRLNPRGFAVNEKEASMSVESIVILRNLGLKNLVLISYPHTKTFLIFCV